MTSPSPDPPRPPPDDPEVQREPGRRGRGGVCSLLLVVLLAIELAIPEIAAGRESLLTHGALQTLFVPRRLVDAHQKAVGDGPLAALADGLVLAF